MTSRARSLALVLSLATLALAGGCKRSSSPASGRSGPVLATVGDDVITVEDLKKRLDETSPFLRARYNTPERRKEFLENLIRNELLAQEAQRRGLDKSAAVQDVIKRAMVQELLKQQLDERMTGADISEADLTRFYQAHVDDYVKPERLRVNTLAVSDRKKAVRLLQEIGEREAKGELNAFQVVAMKESQDPSTAQMGGSLAYLSQAEMAKERGPAFAQAAFALVKPGDKAGPIETPKGYEILKLQNKTVALDKKLEEVKDQVRSRMARERRGKEYDDFIHNLREKGNVKINDEELAKMPATDAAPGTQVPGTLVPAGPPAGAPFQGAPAAGAQQK